MRLRRLQLTHFRSYDALDLDLDAVQSAVVIGPNGAGKSSILRAIEWALFGGQGADDLVAYGEPRTGVTLEFDLNGSLYKVQRGREVGKKSWLVVNRDGEPMTTGSIQETQKRLETAVLGMDVEGFRASIYVPQGEAGSFAAMNAGGRKALLAALLGLADYEEWRQEASTRLRLVDTEYDTLLGRAERARADGAHLRGLAGRLTEAEAKVAELGQAMELLDVEMEAAIERESVAARIAHRNALLRQMEGLRQRAEHAKKNQQFRRELEDRLVALPGAEAEVARHEKVQADMVAYSTVIQRRRDTRAQMDRINEKGRATKRSLDDLAAPGAACPVCHQELGADAKVLTREHLEQELGRLRRDLCELRELDATLVVPDEVEYDYDAHRAAEATLRALRETQRKLSLLGAPEDLEALRHEYRALKADVDAIKVEADPGPLPAELTRRRRTLEQERYEWMDEVAQARHHAEGAERFEKEALELEARAGTSRLDREALAALVTAFSRSGIPAMVIDSAVSAMTDAANDLLSQLAAPYRVRLVTQVAKKSGEGTKETLEVLIDHGGIERPLANFSGGERYRVNIALRIGLASMMAARAGARCEFLLVDEPTDLDGTGMQSLADVLTTIGRQVLLVTHVNDLADRFPQTLRVARASDASPSRVEMQ